MSAFPGATKNKSFSFGGIGILILILAAALIASGCRSPLQTAREKRLREEMAKKMDTIKAQGAAKKSRFEKLLDSAKENMGSADFTALRFVATKEPGYDPYTKNDIPLKEMYDLLDFKNTKALLAKSEETLDKDYLDIETHFITSSAYEIEGNGELASFHLDFALRLLDSIKASSDGKSPATAYKVISVNEEYALIKFLGLKSLDQVTDEENGVMYDIISVIDPISGEQGRLYFNIDIPYSWLSKKFDD